MLEAFGAYTVSGVEAGEEINVSDESHNAWFGSRSLDCGGAPDESASLPVFVHLAETIPQLLIGLADGGFVVGSCSPLIAVRVFMQGLPAEKDVVGDVVMEVDQPREDGSFGRSDVLRRKSILSRPMQNW